MYMKVATPFLVLLMLLSNSNAQDRSKETEIEGVLTDTCCWCGPKPSSCKSQEQPKAQEANPKKPTTMDLGKCRNECVRDKHAHYVLAPSAPCPKVSSSNYGYVLDDTFNDTVAQYTGTTVRIRGVFDDNKHEVQVASIEPTDTPLPKTDKTEVAYGKMTTVNGWVSDDKCGAKGANAGAEACTKKCLAAGAKMVVVTDQDEKILMVENPDALKGHEGHHISARGQVRGDSIHIETAKML
jgi:hypothetical protein